MSFDFKNLDVYKKSKQFYRLCGKMLDEMPTNFVIRDQLGRASLSIVLNIAEGSGKATSNDRRNYFTTARGSVFECVAVRDVLNEEGKITSDVYDANLQLADEISRM